MRNTLINYRQHTEAIRPVNEKRRKTKMANHKEDPVNLFELYPKRLHRVL